MKLKELNALLKSRPALGRLEITLARSEGEGKSKAGTILIVVSLPRTALVISGMKFQKAQYLKPPQGDKCGM